MLLHCVVTVCCHVGAKRLRCLPDVSAELWLSLEEHQYTLELIMGRYRKRMLQLMMAKKELDTKPVLSLHEDHAKAR